LGEAALLITALKGEGDLTVHLDTVLVGVLFLLNLRLLDLSVKEEARLKRQVDRLLVTFLLKCLLL